MSRRELIRNAGAQRWVARPFNGTAVNPPEVLFTTEELLSLPDPSEPIPIPVRFVEVTATRLNVRENPGTAHKAVGALSLGQRVWVTVAEQSAGGLQWSQIVEGGIGKGWIAVIYTKPAATTPGGGGKRNPAGFHLATGVMPGGFLPMLGRLHAAGKPVAMVTVVEDAELCKRIREVSPSTYIVYRPWLFPDHESPARRPCEAWASGEQWLQNFLPIIAQRKPVFDAISLHNEWYPYALANGTPARFGQFYIELMEACHQRGIRCTFGDLAVGWVEPNAYESLVQMFARGAALGMPFRYHSYTSPKDDMNFGAESPWYSMRWVPWVRDFPTLKVVLGESGKYHKPRYVSPAVTVRMMHDHAEQLAPYANQVIGFALWTLRGKGQAEWESDDFEEALPAVERWMLDY